MDKLISTVILTCVAIALAVATMTYYPGIVSSLLNYERLGFDYAYASVKDGQAEIVIRFRNIGQGKLTVVAIEINGADLEPQGNNPFPLELPYGTNARLRLHASPETFRSGVTYEVGIRTDSGRIFTRTVVMP